VTIPCPCEQCPLQLRLEAGDDSAEAFGLHGTLFPCARRPGATPATIAWDGFRFCRGDCGVAVGPGAEMTVVVEPAGQDMGLTGRFEDALGDRAHPAALESLGGGRYRVLATDMPGAWQLIVGVEAPGQTGYFGFVVQVGPSVADALAEARARWDARGPARYAFTAELGWDWGSEGRFGVWVDGDRVVEVPPDRVAPVPWQRFGSVEWLFEVVESMPDEYLRSAVFDPDLGYPTLIMGVGPGHEEWMLWARDLAPTTGPPGAEAQAAITLPWLSRGRIQQIDAIVEATVGEPGPTTIEPPGRWVGLAGDTDAGVIDPLRPGSLPALWDREGETLILFLSQSVTDPPVVTWAARRGEAGLEFLGPADAVPYLDAEVPRLCAPAAGRTAASPATLATSEAQLAVLRAWVERIGAESPGTGPTAARAEELLAEVCRSG
jgi:hypothetical protein